MEYIIKNFETVDSTNEEAKRSTYEPWTVLVAEEQTLGHGRKGDSWFSPKGGLYFSVVLPKSNFDDLQTITILTAFTVAKIIKQDFDLEALIKIPNDVLISGKKVCGVLTENIIGENVKLSVIGIGLNTNIENLSEELQNTATSLKIELKKEVDNNYILNKIVLDLKNQFKSIS
jgi:BirA family transcriptional regulator, biotin operon repressor / biotin---[acetyl-CoA-carboxylase] ligase